MNQTNQRIVELIAEGMADKEIAKELNKKKRTIEKAISRMLKKYNCRNRAHLVVTIRPSITEESE